MSRVVLVSNRVLDLRKAAQAGGVAVALADVVRARRALWFGWNGEIKAEDQPDVVEREGRIATVPLSAKRPRGLLPRLRQLGAVAGVSQPARPRPVRGRLSSIPIVDVNRRLAGLLQPMLRADDIIWVHDYHLIPLRRRAEEARACRTRSASICTFPFPPWQTFMAIPEHQELARALAAYDLIGLQTKADVANLIDYMANGVFGRIVPDGRIRLFDRLVSVASFPIGIDVADFAKAKRDGGLVQGARR